MDEKDKNRLKFQMRIFLKETIGYNYAIAFVVCFVIMLIGVIFGDSNVSIAFGIKDNRIPAAFSYILIALLYMQVVGVREKYKVTASYFMSMGYTRKRYYDGNTIFSLIFSTVFTIISVLYFIMSIKNHTEHINGARFMYMGYAFSSITIDSIFKIIIITFLIITLIFNIANFISVISFGNKPIRTITNVIGLAIILLLCQNRYSLMIKNFIFYTDKSFILSVIVCIAANVFLYTLGRSAFMQIDII